MASQGLEYVVDLVLCIDATGSMSGLIDRVKDGALRLHSDLQDRMADKSKVIDSLRVRVIGYRDYYVDGDLSLAASNFFHLDDQSTEFKDFVSGLRATGGGDEPESGQEALALAMHSDWAEARGKGRQVIVLWTDASAHPLEKRHSMSGHSIPNHLPEDFDGLTDLWEGQEGVQSGSKRLVLFAPDAYPWTDIANHWSATIHHASKAGEGLDDVDYDTIVDTIANSIQ